MNSVSLQRAGFICKVNQKVCQFKGLPQIFVNFAQLFFMTNLCDTDISPIDKPSEWRLLLRADARSLSAMAFAPSRRDMLVAGETLLPPDAASPLEALEEAVYSAGWLTTLDFGSREISLAGLDTMLIPSEAGAAAEEIYDFALPRSEADSLLTAPTGDSAAIIAAAVPRRLEAFLTRTFPSIRLHPHLEGLCRYFMTLSSRGNTRKIYLNFRHEAVDIVAIDRGAILMANSFACPTPDDAVYYTIASRDMLGMTEENGTAPAAVMVSGTGPLREPAVASLRRFCKDVMPVIFPGTMLLTGRRAAELPFDLTALAIELN